jgi:hypothetical protein
MNHMNHHQHHQRQSQTPTPENPHPPPNIFLDNENVASSSMDFSGFKRGREDDAEGAEGECDLFSSLATGGQQHKRSRSITYDRQQHTQHLERQRAAADSGMRGANNKRQRDSYVNEELLMKRGRSIITEGSGVSMTDLVDYGQMNIGQHRVSTPEVLRLWN